MPERFALISSPETVRAAFAYGDEPAFPPRYNIAPTQPIAIVTAAPQARGGARRFGLARWGFLPGFVKDPAKFPLLIKARAETLTERPSFRAAVKRRRCLVPADGWYEWLRDGRGAPKRTFLVRRRDSAPMGFAGLMETWIDPHGGEIDTACIVTIAANRLIAPIADRMPAILAPADCAAWLDNDSVGAEPAIGLLRRAPEDALVLIAIGSAVNRVGAEGPQVQRPLESPAV
ncbi:MAG: SOS response-associated peptidase [Roseiarcus sp.]|jgi:putative SOS response-associated peptidase YedK